MLPEPKSQREAVASIFAIARNVSGPFGAPYKRFGVYNTEYRTVSDLTDKVYYFELTTSPNVVWADLTKFNLSPDAPARPRQHRSFRRRNEEIHESRASVLNLSQNISISWSTFGCTSTLPASTSSSKLCSWLRPFRLE
jgi:hypothetical protein